MRVFKKQCGFKIVNWQTFYKYVDAWKLKLVCLVASAARVLECIGTPDDTLFKLINTQKINLQGTFAMCADRTLAITDRQGVLAVITPDKTITVGSALDCDVVLPGLSVSHASLTHAPFGFIITATCGNTCVDEGGQLRQVPPLADCAYLYGSTPPKHCIAIQFGGGPRVLVQDVNRVLAKGVLSDAPGRYARIRGICSPFAQLTPGPTLFDIVCSNATPTAQGARMVRYCAELIDHNPALSVELYMPHMYAAIEAGNAATFTVLMCGMHDRMQRCHFETCLLYAIQANCEPIVRLVLKCGNMDADWLCTRVDQMVEAAPDRIRMLCLLHVPALARDVCTAGIVVAAARLLAAPTIEWALRAGAITRCTCCETKPDMPEIFQGWSVGTHRLYPRTAQRTIANSAWSLRRHIPWDVIVGAVLPMCWHDWWCTPAARGVSH